LLLEPSGKDSEYIRELSNLAFLQLERGLYRESRENLLTCLFHFKNLKDRLGQAAVYGILGILYFKKGEYILSNENYELSLQIYRELNQITEVITCLKNIGNNYLKLNNYDEAIEIFLNCSTISSENDDIYNLLDCLANLIHIHEIQQRWDVVYELYKKSLEAFKQLKDNKGIITSYFNLGILQKKNQNLNESIRFFKKGTNIAIESNYAELILKGLSYIGEILVYQDDLREAKNIYIKALSLARKIKSKNSILQLKVLLNSLGLSNLQIDEELNKYNEYNN
jgi:tetratricopeptide (TPR) repeat protein